MISRGTRRYARQQLRRFLARLASPFLYRSLPKLARIHGTDKWGRHNYAGIYERHFGRLRREPITLLEIGIGGHRSKRIGGASLRMWKAFFRKGRIVGIDIFDKSQLAEPRVTIIQGDQGDPHFLETVGRDYGPFDLVIDDGSHRNSDVITSFQTLFKHVTINGMYAIEDLQTSYWPRFGGDPENLNSEQTSVGYLKTLIDGLNWAERPDAAGQFDRDIVGLHFYHNLVVVERGINDEPGGDPLAGDT